MNELVYTYSIMKACPASQVTAFWIIYLIEHIFYSWNILGELPWTLKLVWSYSLVQRHVIVNVSCVVHIIRIR